MTKKHFQAAAAQVKSILDGDWTHEPPEWTNETHYNEVSIAWPDYVRAVQTAEAYILLFQEFNPRFDQQQFMKACGLAAAPNKTKAR